VLPGNTIFAVIFIELPQFTEAVNELVDDASYLKFQTELLAMPDRGDVMQGRAA
jgi:hypothetical protein